MLAFVFHDTWCLCPHFLPGFAAACIFRSGAGQIAALRLAANQDETGYDLSVGGHIRWTWAGAGVGTQLLARHEILACEQHGIVLSVSVNVYVERKQP